MFEFRITYREAMRIAKKLAHSMSREQTRYYLSGFYVHKQTDGKHYAVSTDGHRLTRVQFHGEYEDNQGDFPAVIFPELAVKQIESLKVPHNQRATHCLKIIVDMDAQVYRFECLGNVLVGKLRDGTFPDYNTVIPEGWEQFNNTYGPEVGGFNARYLAEASKAASYDADAFQYKPNGRRVQLRFEGTKPAVIVEPDAEVLHILMPMRA